MGNFLKDNWYLIVAFVIGGLVIAGINAAIIGTIDKSSTVVARETFTAKIVNVTYGWDNSLYFAYLHLENGTIISALDSRYINTNQIVLNSTYQITTYTNGLGQTYLDHYNRVEAEP